MWESHLSGSERGWSATLVWMTYCGTAGKPGGKQRKQTSSYSPGSLQPTRTSFSTGGTAPVFPPPRCSRLRDRALGFSWLGRFLGNPGYRGPGSGDVEAFRRVFSIG